MGSGISGGKSGSSGSTSSAFGTVLGNIAQQINAETDPTRKLFMNQMQQVLQGNLFGSGSIPLIQSGVGAARQAAGQSLQGAQANLAKSGAANSPFASAISAMIGQQGNQAVADVPINIANAYVGQTGSAVSNIGGQALSGLSNAGQLNNRFGGSSYNIGGSGSFPGMQ